MATTAIPLEELNTTSSEPNNVTYELRPVSRRRQLFVLISSFLAICITIGFNQSYGVFQSYYTSSEQTILPASARNQSALVAFVGTLGYGLTWAGSIFVNPIMARCSLRGNRIMGAIGVLGMSAGFLLASFSTQVRSLPTTIPIPPTIISYP